MSNYSDEPGLYFIKKDSEVIYIGVSKNIRKRLGQHIITRDPEVSVETECMNYKKAKNLEYTRIREYKPKLNKYPIMADIDNSGDVICKKCEYSWSYSGSKTWPEKITCPECAQSMKSPFDEEQNKKEVSCHFCDYEWVPRSDNPDICPNCNSSGWENGEVRKYNYDISDCLEALKEADEVLDSVSRPKYRSLDIKPACSTIEKKVGGWNKAKEEAGID